MNQGEDPGGHRPVPGAERALTDVAASFKLADSHRQVGNLPPPWVTGSIPNSRRRQANAQATQLVVGPRSDLRRQLPELHRPSTGQRPGGADYDGPGPPPDRDGVRLAL